MGAIRSGGTRMQTVQRPILDLTSPALSVACTGRSNSAAGSMVAILMMRQREGGNAIVIIHFQI